jgi:hypothetical protein
VKKKTADLFDKLSSTFRAVPKLLAECSTPVSCRLIVSKVEVITNITCFDVNNKTPARILYGFYYSEQTVKCFTNIMIFIHTGDGTYILGGSTKVLTV